MKITRTSLISVTSLLVGGFIGASALIALADSTWTSAPSCSTMPCNNTPAPLNVGASKQTKSGWLALTSGLITGGLQILNGSALTGGANGAVLTADANGNATWAASTASGLKTTGYVDWTESFNSATPVVGLQLTCIKAGGDGSCSPGSYSIPYSGGSFYVAYSTSFGCINGPMLDTVAKTSQTIVVGVGVVTTIEHVGYCISILN